MTVWYRNSRTGRIVQQIEPSDIQITSDTARSLAATAKHMINTLDNSKRWNRCGPPVPKPEVFPEPPKQDGDPNKTITFNPVIME